MDQSTMVANDHGDGSMQANALVKREGPFSPGIFWQPIAVAKPKLEGSCMEYIKASKKYEGVDPAVVNLATSNVKPETLSHYASGWRIFAEWFH